MGGSGHLPYIVGRGRMRWPAKHINFITDCILPDPPIPTHHCFFLDEVAKTRSTFLFPLEELIECPREEWELVAQ